MRLIPSVRDGSWPAVDPPDICKKLDRYLKLIFIYKKLYHNDTVWYAAGVLRVVKKSFFLQNCRPVIFDVLNELGELSELDDQHEHQQHGQ